MTGPMRSEIERLYADGIPPFLIARRLQTSMQDVYEAVAWTRGRIVPKCQRIARVERIKANIAAFPGKSYCYPEERA